MIELRKCGEMDRVSYLGHVWYVRHGFRGKVYLTRTISVKGQHGHTYARSVTIDRPNTVLVERVSE